MNGEKNRVVSTVTTNVPTTKEGKEIKLMAKLMDTGQITVRQLGLNRPVLLQEYQAGLGRLAAMLEPGQR